MLNDNMYVLDFYKTINCFIMVCFSLLYGLVHFDKPEDLPKRQFLLMVIEILAENDIKLILF